MTKSKSSAFTNLVVLVFIALSIDTARSVKRVHTNYVKTVLLLDDDEEFKPEIAKESET